MAKRAEEAAGRDEEFSVPDRIPLIPLQDTVVYPYMRTQLNVERATSIAATDQALLGERLVVVVAQRELNPGEPTAEGLYDIGTVCVILQSIPHEKGTIVLAQGLFKAKITAFWEDDGFKSASIERIADLPITDEVQERALVQNTIEKFADIALSSETVPRELLHFLQNIKDPAAIAFAVGGNLRLDVPLAQSILEESDPVRRLRLVYSVLAKEAEVVSMQNRIKSAADEEIKKHQKEYYLREQLRAIQNELGGSGGRVELADLQKKITAQMLPEVAEKEAMRQMARLERMPPESPEAESIRNYLEWVIELPWQSASTDSVDFAQAKRILDEDHAYLEKVKERILEFLAVHKLRRTARGSIMCFVGPPGVGKTSLGRSIARAMGRNFVRISLGGIHDEADIRGHRRTYIGAMPGRIIHALKQAGTKNPVFMLDEIDKIGRDYRGGDPYSALLEVLDPEQNNSFTDHYLNAPFDLSDVVFITTANSLEHIPTPLLDRMEIIPLPGYTEQEKLDIARTYLVPRQIKENGLDPNVTTIDEEAVTTIISRYTREAGLRNLERSIGKICRKIAKKIAEGSSGQFHIAAADVEEYMGEPPYQFDTELEEDQVGTVTGLAWTPTGGEILFVEAMAMVGKPSLHLTGSLGDVMKESADAALSYIRANAERFSIPNERFGETALHIHVPAGALPKDGPSAGVTMATAILSTLTRNPVKREVAMTGEITLRGKVLPIGGLKEKILGAVRAGMRVVIIPEGNVRDLKDIPAQVLDQVKVIPAKMIDDVFNAALTRGPVIAGLKQGPALMMHPPALEPLKGDQI